MANKDLSRKSHHVKGDEAFWWYEEPGGLALMYHTHNSHGNLETVEKRISWRALRNALRRKDK